MRSRITERQTYNCFQSTCQHIAEHDCSAVCLNDRAGDCQAKADAAALVAATVAATTVAAPEPRPVSVRKVRAKEAWELKPSTRATYGNKYRS